MVIIGRQKEQALLKRCYESRKPEFLAVYGRRRVGKTYLIREYFGERIIFSLTGTSKGLTGEQLARFKDSYEFHSGEQAGEISNWYDAFKMLRSYIIKTIQKKNDKGKVVVFIDEISWLATQNSSFLAALDYFWNTWGSTCPELMLIICGSATTWIIKNIVQNKGGLHNRLTYRMQIHPYMLEECEKHLKSNGVSLSRMQIAELYMAIGGIPYYLDFAQPGMSVPQLIDFMFFNDAAPLADEFDELYAALFKFPAMHIAIIETLAGRISGFTQKEIAEAINERTGGTFSKTLRELEQCGFIRKIRGFGQNKNSLSYKLIDFYTLFYLKHVSNYSGSDARYWQNHYNKGMQLAWNGFAFERLCAAHYEQIKQRLGILGVSTGIYTWKSRNSKNGAQIDLIIDREDGIINLCEIKFTGSKVHIDEKYDYRLRERGEIFRAETGTKKALHTTMITTYGIDDTSYRGEIQSEVLLEDLYRPLLM